MESKAKKIIIIGVLTFLAVVVATLSITLPIVLRNKDTQANNSTNNSTSTSSSVSNATNSMTTELAMDEITTNGAMVLRDIQLQDALSLLQNEPIRTALNKAQQLSIPSPSNLADRVDQNENRRKTKS